jgi:NADH-quinone oxidoreductase subunit J
MALMSVTATKIFRSAVWLLFSLIGIAGLYFWMEMEFIAAVQIIVYVGGIVVLIIFSIFLTQAAGDNLPQPSLSRKIAAGLSVLFGIAFAGSLIYTHGFQSTGLMFDNEVNRIGKALLSPDDGGFLLPFEVVSILLLAAMVACIVIAMKPEKEETASHKKENIIEEQEEITQ